MDQRCNKLTEADMKLFTVVRVERVKREKKDGVSKATVRSFTRVFFTAEDQTALDALLETDKKTDRIFRKLMPEALQLAGMNAKEKFSWNELAGSCKGGKPGFIMREDKGHEVTVTFGAEEAPEAETKPAATEGYVMTDQENLMASISERSKEVARAAA
jgi:hypothetical protein